MVIARYHTTEGNNPEHPLVKAVVQQMEDSVVNNTNKEVWDWRGFFKKGARSRVLVLIIYSIFQSWNGGGIIGQVCQFLSESRRVQPFGFPMAPNKPKLIS